MANKKKDFFISYTEKDESWAIWIGDTLEKSDKKYKVTLQKWDIRAGDNFVYYMHRALIDSERFIAVISEKYFESMYCQSEWTAAFTKDPNLEKAQFIPVRIENVTPQGLFAPIVYIDLYGVDDEEAKKRLLDGVSLDDRPTNEVGFPGTKKPQSPGDMPLNNLPHSRNPYFTGRKEKLDLMYNNFQSGDVVSLVQSVSGLGGVGKTSIALEYAYKHSHEYETIWWINAESSTSTLEAYRDLALKKKIIAEDAKPDIVIEAIKNWVNQHDKWLFIYDNADVDDFNKWLEPYLPQSRKGHVLITTRSNFFPKSKSVDIIVFNETEAISFLKIRTGKYGDGCSDDLAKVLSERLQYLPLALEQAAAYIEQTPNVTYQGYIDLIEEYGIDLFEKKNQKGLIFT